MKETGLITLYFSLPILPIQYPCFENIQLMKVMIILTNQLINMTDLLFFSLFQLTFFPFNRNLVSHMH